MTDTVTQIDFAPEIELDLPPGEILQADMADNAEMASAYLKALSHPGRLMILCYLIEGEKTVTDLELLLGARQSSVSQHLARLRADKLVRTRREGKAIHYSLADERTKRVIGLLHELFCRAA
ncbi:metalloregulator ArsR/SmtB family transcription factor [Poseidonocella sp. HB161398]|uniref:ArsR/SmtB family transcription factor n=1 Tax=Poseidonocella sp. HB161398 TaxID=2320855 RepID=UPI001F0D9B34|nr:metalloregulator ArsR/SmtB family transcription factor [Poseidonocella sp. HB161398]